MKFIKENENTLKDTWQIYFLALIQQKTNVYLFSDQLDDETITKALLNPVNDIARLIDELVRKIGSQAQICVLPEGPHTILY